jgi:hypothetical protein
MALPPFSCRLIADVGISLGDEGKGRLIPEIVEELRATPGQRRRRPEGQRGRQRGPHGRGVKLNLLPSGVVEREIAHLAIGSGVVADPRKILWEATPLEAKGYSVRDRLLIDERTMTSDLTHRLLDLAEEDYRVNVLKEESRGSTGRGISAAYNEETGHWQMYFSDFLAGPNFFARKLAQRADRACRMIQHVYRVSESSWHGFFDRLTEAEKRANAETIASGVFGADEFDFSRFRGKRPFELDLDCLTSVYWKAGTALRKNVGEVRELVLGRAAPRPHRHRGVRAGLLAGQAPRVLPHLVPHVHARVLREREHTRPADPHLWRREGLRHEGGHPHVPHGDAGVRAPGREAEEAGVRNEHRQAEDGGLVRRGREGGRPALRGLPGPDDQQAGRPLLVGGLEGQPARLHGVRGDRREAVRARAAQRGRAQGAAAGVHELSRDGPRTSRASGGSRTSPATPGATWPAW